MTYTSSITSVLGRALDAMEGDATPNEYRACQRLVERAVEIADEPLATSENELKAQRAATEKLEERVARLENEMGEHRLRRARIESAELRQKLLDTGTEKLVEGNHWNDFFWGVCRGKGHNHLGKILMRVRNEIRAEP